MNVTARFDLARFCNELVALAEASDGDRSGLPTLRRLMEFAQWSLDLPGAAFVESGPDSGRVIVATGSARASAGRRVATAEAIGRILTTGPLACGDASALPQDLREVLDAPEGGGFLLAQVAVGNRPIGLLAASTPPGWDRNTDQRRAVGRLLSLYIARLYRADNALPLHADPVPRMPAEVGALLDGDGLASWVSPRGIAALDPGTVVVGKPFPLPVPDAGSTIEHNMPDGRWLALTARRLASGGELAITVKDVTEARRWERSRELFVALTSHELRTPVTVIKGYADTLSARFDALDEAGKREAVQVLGQRAGELARLLDRLLAAVGQPGLPTVVAPFSLGDAVQQALDTMPADVRGRLSLHLEGLPGVVGEPAAIASVVGELVTNATKYAPAATGPIVLTGVADARTAGLRVEDRGIGVRPEHVERAFERFWQADVGDQRRFGGVGLGLYLVRQILERQHGWVSLRPRPDGGTVAEFRLPRV